MIFFLCMFLWTLSSLHAHGNSFMADERSPTRSTPQKHWVQDAATCTLKTLSLPLNFGHTVAISLINTPAAWMTAGLAFLSQTEAIAPRGWDTTFCPKKMLSPQDLEMARADWESCLNLNCAKLPVCFGIGLQSCIISKPCKKIIHLSNFRKHKIVLKLCKRGACQNRGVSYFPKLFDGCIDHDLEDDTIFCASECFNAFCQNYPTKACAPLSWTQWFLSFFSLYCDEGTCPNKAFSWINFSQIKIQKDTCHTHCDYTCTKPHIDPSPPFGNVSI